MRVLPNSVLLPGVWGLPISTIDFSGTRECGSQYEPYVVLKQLNVLGAFYYSMVTTLEGRRK